MVAPAAERAAVVVLVERPFEAFRDVDHTGETGRFERRAGIARADPAAANQQHRPQRVAGQPRTA